MISRLLDAIEGPVAKSIRFVSKRSSFFGSTCCLSNFRASASAAAPHYKNSDFGYAGCTEKQQFWPRQDLKEPEKKTWLFETIRYRAYTRASCS